MKFNNLIFLSSLSSVFSNSVKFDSLKLSITDSTGESKLTEKLEYPTPLKHKLDLEASDVIRLSYKLVKGEDKLPADLPYNTLVIENEESSLYSYHPVQSGKTGNYKLNLPYRNIAKSIKNIGESANIYLLVRSNSKEEAVKYKLGTLGLPDKRKETEPKPAEFGPQPLIHHTFRPDEKSPPKILSYVFSVLVLSPWALLVIGWISFDLNFRKFPTDPYKLVLNVGFLGTLVAYTILNYQYWTVLNLFETIYYFTIITSFSLPLGYLTLKNHN